MGVLACSFLMRISAHCRISSPSCLENSSSAVSSLTSADQVDWYMLRYPSARLSSGDSRANFLSFLVSWNREFQTANAVLEALKVCFDREGLKHAGGLVKLSCNVSSGWIFGHTLGQGRITKSLQLSATSSKSESATSKLGKGSRGSPISACRGHRPSSYKISFPVYIATFWPSWYSISVVKWSRQHSGSDVPSRLDPDEGLHVSSPCSRREFSSWPPARRWRMESVYRPCMFSIHMKMTQKISVVCRLALELSDISGFRCRIVWLYCCMDINSKSKADELVGPSLCPVMKRRCAPPRAQSAYFTGLTMWANGSTNLYQKVQPYCQFW